MEDIIGIKVIDNKIGEAGFITWGRVFDRTNEEPLINAIKKNLTKFGITDPISIKICETLQEVSSYSYFYEALFAFAQEKIAEDKDYRLWCNAKKKAIEAGEEIYFLGLKTVKNSNMPGAISHGFYYRI